MNGRKGSLGSGSAVEGDLSDCADEQSDQHWWSHFGAENVQASVNVAFTTSHHITSHHFTSLHFTSHHISLILLWPLAQSFTS